MQYYASDEEWVIQEASNANALAVGAALGVRMSGLDVGLRYMSSRPEFHLTAVDWKGGRATATEQRTISAYAVTVGLRLF